MIELNENGPLNMADEDASVVDRRVDRDSRRRLLMHAMGAHLLAHGLAGSSLRKLAAAAGTSDRMLLYYFADRDDLLTSLLQHIAADMTKALEAADSGERRPWADLLQQLWVSARTPELRPFMLLFLELTAAAGRGEEPHRAAAERIAEGFAKWVADRLNDPVAERQARAALLIATLDGLFLLDSAGLGDAAVAAAALF